jgi:hypothetical protein
VGCAGGPVRTAGRALMTHLDLVIQVEAIDGLAHCDRALLLQKGQEVPNGEALVLQDSAKLAGCLGG